MDKARRKAQNARNLRRNKVGDGSRNRRIRISHTVELRKTKRDELVSKRRETTMPMEGHNESDTADVKTHALIQSLDAKIRDQSMDYDVTEYRVTQWKPMIGSGDAQQQATAVDEMTEMVYRSVSEKNDKALALVPRVKKELLTEPLLTLFAPDSKFVSDQLKFQCAYVLNQLCQINNHFAVDIAFGGHGPGYCMQAVNAYEVSALVEQALNLLTEMVHVDTHAQLSQWLLETGITSIISSLYAKDMGPAVEGACMWLLCVLIGDHNDGRGRVVPIEEMLRLVAPCVLKSMNHSNYAVRRSGMMAASAITRFGDLFNGLMFGMGFQDKETFKAQLSMALVSTLSEAQMPGNCLLPAMHVLSNLTLSKSSDVDELFTTTGLIDIMFSRARGIIPAASPEESAAVCETTLWLLSNVCDSSLNIVNALINAGLPKLVVDVLEGNSSAMAKENVLYIIYNIAVLKANDAITAIQETPRMFASILSVLGPTAHETSMVALNALVELINVRPPIREAVMRAGGADIVHELSYTSESADVKDKAEMLYQCHLNESELEQEKRREEPEIDFSMFNPNGFTTNFSMN